MTEIEKLADRLDPHKQVGWERLPHDKGRPTFRTLIEAATALRQHATALEIGRGIGREEAAEIADGWLQQYRDRKIDFVRAEKFASDAVADIRDLIRTASPALDVEALVERVAQAWWQVDYEDEEWSRGPWSTAPVEAREEYKRHARAVVASLGVGE